MNPCRHINPCRQRANHDIPMPTKVKSTSLDQLSRLDQLSLDKDDVDGIVHEDWINNCYGSNQETIYLAL